MKLYLVPMFKTIFAVHNWVQCVMELIIHQPQFRSAVHNRTLAADESIMQSLTEINSEYPSVQSPARPDAPVFDATPGGVDASRVPHRCGSTGPLFDSTPLLGPKNETFNVTDPVASGSAVTPNPGCTPIWQDTPSQSVDGTEVVTQPQDAQEQLDKYEAARAERVAKFQKEVKTYERRKSLRTNVSERNPLVGPDVAADDLTVWPPRQVRPRREVAKRKVARSPRGSARMGGNTIAPAARMMNLLSSGIAKAQNV